MNYTSLILSQQNYNTINATIVCDFFYEKQINTTTTCHYHYIYDETGAVALHIYAPSTDNTDYPAVDSLYYIHTDHLGSYVAFTNTYKQLKQRHWFDPWGGSSNHNLRGDPPVQMFTLLTPRGFTGHEHYPEFKIINMNGRLYDPVIGRFFSPDNFVQTPEFTQGFNRYSYCLNNPLKYTDPSGETWYDVNGDRKRIDDGVDDLLIEVSQRQFNRLERKFDRNRSYEAYRDKMSEKNGFTIFGNFGEFSRNGNGLTTLQGVEMAFNRPTEQTYSEWNNLNT